MTRKTSVEIDEDLFSAARHVLETGTLRETVEEAFRAVIRNAARREEVRALSTMDGLDLGDSEVMTGAWRS